ncbi:helix-turn-helix domain-containing protein [Rhodococcus hoagii]|nr:helix-turn-helix domain-containing protein [Prescottella equi]NKV95029.1 helix-turn-helix domain-containing protein [Prescottella equi]NKV95282.1 helix-turn-helix domain-containing protein [Prescottella equi]NKW07675.1 helix-turn-helix domain-containing protein [Prescottella equi]NKW07985.1 helix-turn-helix domain-containing protein [Prescottella equi]
MKRTTLSGGAIRDLRNAAGLTLEEVATAAHVSPTYLSRVERGERRPKPRWTSRVLFAIAAFLETEDAHLTERIPA